MKRVVVRLSPTTETMMAGIDRVRRVTNSTLNHQIDRDTELRLAELANDTSPAITNRILALEQEWDFDRVVETEAAITGLIGLVLAIKVDRRFVLIPGMAAAMLALHALAGPYLLLPLFRRFGVRTRDEIDREKYAAKSLRGDFKDLPEEAVMRAHAAWEAACL